jgi:hypothetical protein
MFSAGSAQTITLGQIDDFQSLMTVGWTMGPNSPQLPFVVNTGGPLGANDAFVKAVSTGTTGANSKMIMFNQQQWTGNYISAGVTGITTEMANLGSNPLYMRVAIQDTFGSEYGSTTAVPLPPDGHWYPVSFDMTASGLSFIQGGSSLNTALSNVGVLRILSAKNGPQFVGDTVQATLGVDDISALPEPSITPVIVAFTLCLARYRKG